MSPLMVQELVREGKAILIDVREEEEILLSGMADCALWMPTSKVAEDHTDWKSFKSTLPRDKELILYCRSGARSGQIAELLAMEGYKTCNMGGFCEWQCSNLPIRKLR